jgi:hypothetical protein
LLAAVVALAGGASTPRPLAASPAELCERWASVAAAEHDVPEALILGIARAETGRTAEGTLRPWPWTVNAAGQGRWFATRDEARAFATAQRAAGVKQIDLGCFQLNLRWHGRAFGSFDDMLDPARNARYAARFLAALRVETGNWTRAAGAFHSRTPERARAYLARLSRLIAGPHGRPDLRTSSRVPPRILSPDTGRLALAPQGMGSLVPLPDAASARLIDLGSAGASR